MYDIIYMLSWLTKLFNKKKDRLDMENVVDATVVASSKSVSLPPKKRKHKLEIRLLEADYTDIPDGAPPKWRPINMGRDAGKPIIVEVADKKELMDLMQRYAMCDQQIEIIREIDPFDDDQQPSSSRIPQKNQAIPVMQQPLVRQPVDVQPVISSSPAANACTPKPKPKIVTIGDMQVKYDGDKVYQKQWVKLSSSEAANFRVVNDSNNKLVSLNGKHIECRKWVIVEEDNENDDAIESIVSGE